MAYQCTVHCSFHIPQCSRFIYTIMPKNKNSDKKKLLCFFERSEIKIGFLLTFTIYVLFSIQYFLWPVHIYWTIAKYFVCLVSTSSKIRLFIFDAYLVFKWNLTFMRVLLLLLWNFIIHRKLWRVENSMHLNCMVI